MDKKSLVLHAIVFHKNDKINTKAKALGKARAMFKNESIKGFVRDSEPSLRVRVRPKTTFDKTSYVSKKLNNDVTIILGAPLGKSKA